MFLSFFPSLKIKAHALIDRMTEIPKWNSNISIGSSEAISQARASGINEVVVGRFCNNLALVYAKYQITLNHIWNTHKTGVPTVLLPPTVLSKKGPN